MPVMHFIRVDLPAPLSPTRPTTVPASSLKVTPRSASTWPKRFCTASSASRLFIAPRSGLLQALGVDPVEPDREDQHSTYRHLLVVGLHREQVQAVLQHAHDQGTDEGPEH